MLLGIGLFSITKDCFAQIQNQGKVYYHDAIGNNYSTESNVVFTVIIDEYPLLITLGTQTTMDTVNSKPVPGADIIYIITYENIGTQAIQSLSITNKPDLTHAEYVADSLRMGTAGSTYETAVGKSDRQDSDGADWDGMVVNFDIGNVEPAEKGQVYFRVRIR